MRFKNKHIVITGGSGGIGQAIAQLLAQQGALLTLMDLKPPVAIPKNTRFMQVDITDRSSLEQAFAEVSFIDGFVHAAASLIAAPLLEMTSDALEQLVAINVLGSFNLLQIIGQKMVIQEQGTIVVIGSNSGTTPRLGIGGYGATKAATHMLTKSFALELAGKGIRCNLVSPGSTRTEMLVQTWSDRYGESETIQGDISKFRLGIPLNKIAEPVDIAKSVSFLLSDDANHITMHDLRVDGGATLSQ